MAHYETTKELVWSDNWHDAQSPTPDPPETPDWAKDVEWELINTTAANVSPDKVIVFYTWKIKG